MELGNDVIQTVDGGYAVIGYNYISGSFFLKIDPNGDTAWTKTYAGLLGFPETNSIKQTTDHGFILGGYFHSGNPDQALLIKTDSLGNISWSKIFGGIYDDRILCVQQTNDGGYVFTGYTGISSAYNDYDVYIVKLNSSGGMQWTKTYGDSESNSGEYIEQTTDGGFIISGYSENYLNFSNQYAFLLKIDAAGTLSWIKKISSPYLFEITSTTCPQNVRQTNDGGFILLGDLVNQTNGASLLVKTDSLGTLQWTKAYSDISAGMLYEISSGGYVISGISNTSNEATLLRVNSIGDPVWSRIYNAPFAYFTVACSVRPTTDSGFVFCGQIKSSLDSGSILLVKTDSLGNGNCFGTIQNLIDSTVNLICTSPTYLSSFMNYASGIILHVENYGINIIDPCFTGIEFIPQTPITIFPNPFSTSTTLQFTTTPKNAELNIYNLYGQEIKTIKNISANKIEIDRGDLSSGIYFVRLVEGNILIGTGKIIVTD